MSFTGRASNHQRAHVHKARPEPAHPVNDGFHRAIGADQKILVEEEEGRDGAHHPSLIPDHEIAIVKAGNRIFDHLVVAMILAFAVKGVSPTPAAVELGARHHVYACALRRHVTCYWRTDVHMVSFRGVASAALIRTADRCSIAPRLWAEAASCGERAAWVPSAVAGRHAALLMHNSATTEAVLWIST